MKVMGRLVMVVSKVQLAEPTHRCRHDDVVVCMQVVSHLVCCHGDSHGREVGPCWHLVRIMSNDRIVGLIRRVWDQKLPDLHLSVTETSVGYSGIAKSAVENTTPISSSPLAH